ncbi:MAG: penicillin acylase family protein [Actinobacteria bacterium]|nr:penicillin acylase family protein [Actinomycetota bacterium]
MTGLQGDVTITRDPWGIPVVQASSAHDVFFAQGYAQAEDRLGQLEYDRRRAYGRWAEVVGPSALGFDAFTRRCGLHAVAQREFETLTPDAQLPLLAYAAGVNAYLESDAPLPPDLRAVGITPARWEPWDCCAIFLVRHVVFASWQLKLWRGRLAVALGPERVVRLGREAPFEVPLIVPPGDWWRPSPRDPSDLAAVAAASSVLVESANGSNAWALSGARTASGKPVVAGDPHRLIEAPGVYYQCRLSCPDFDAAGLAFVGIPGFPHFAQTDRVAWCVTNANGDYQDLYVERFRSGGAEYETANGWRAPTRRVEVVDVHGEDAVEIECFDTRHGPIVFGDPARGCAVALRATSLVEPSSGLSVIEPMLRARDIDGLDAVMRAWVDPVNNFVTADVDGNIGYRTVGHIPVRTPANAWGPVPGWTDEHEWQGIVPFDEMPRVRNPGDGLVVTANQRIVGDEYAHFLSLDYASPDRARRLHTRLDDLWNADATAMAAVHRDRRSLPADVWVDRFGRLQPRDDHERAALDVLASWNREMDADSAGAAVYAVVRDAVGQVLAHNPELASLRAPIEGEPTGTFQPLQLRLWPLLTGLLATDDGALLPEGRTWDDVLATALSDGVGVLRTALGEDVSAWRWGALHRCAPLHPLSGPRSDVAAGLDPPASEMGGDADTVFNAAHPAGFGFGVTGSSVARYVFDLADRSRSRWVVPLGSSGDPGSPHFADQQSAWVAGELLPISTPATAGASVTRLSASQR